VVTDETSEDRSPLFHHDDSSPTPINNTNASSNKTNVNTSNEIPSKKKAPSSQTSKQQKNLSSMCSSSKVGLSDVNLKNFKIPKQNNSNNNSSSSSSSSKVASSSSPTKSNKNNQLPKGIKNEPSDTLVSMSLEFNQNLNAALSS